MRKTLWIAAVLFGFPACRTEEIATPVTTIPASQGELGPDQGQLLILFAPTVDTFEEQQALALAARGPYAIYVDGGQLTGESAGGRTPLAVFEGDVAGWFFLPAGPHHLVIAPASGGSTIFAGDAEIAPGLATKLYLFGHRDAVQGRFVSYPAVPAPGTLHVSVLNLVRLGPGLEVVSCAASTTCAPLSSPLAFGESFDADFAAGTSDDTRFLLATGASIGYRQLGTAALSAPPVQPLSSLYSSLYSPPENFRSYPADLWLAPIYTSPQGNVLMWALGNTINFTLPKPTT